MLSDSSSVLLKKTVKKRVTRVKLLTTLIEDAEPRRDSVVLGTGGDAPLPAQVQKEEGARPPNATQEEGPAHVHRPVCAVHLPHRLLLLLVQCRSYQLPRRHLCAGWGS